MNHVMNHVFDTKWGQKTIRVMCGDVTDHSEQVDLLVCSAFKNDYVPTYTSLIGSLYWNCGISVEDLSHNPALNLKDLGVWVSKPIENSFMQRIACVEILDYYGQAITADQLRSLYDTLFFAVKKCSMLGYPVKTLAMHVLGTGDQNIELEKSLMSLLIECLSAFQTIKELRTVILFNRREDRSRIIAEIIRKNSSGITSNMAFISYSHHDIGFANLIANGLEENGIKPWIDHKMIRNPDFAEDIAKGISESKAFLLLVSPASMESDDVYNEFCTAIHYSKCAGLKIIPVILKHTPYPYKYLYYLASRNHHDISEPPQEEKIMKLCRFLRSTL